MANIPTFKCAIDGNGGVGKTAFIKRHLGGEFQQTYDPTVGVDVHTLTFNTNIGQIRFDVCDFAGQEKCDTTKGDYYIGSQCAIIMFDVTNGLSYSATSEYCEGIRQKCGNIPIIIAGNKCDISDSNIENVREYCEDIEKKRGGDPTLFIGNKCDIVLSGVVNVGDYCCVSAKSGQNIAHPFILLARKLMHNDMIQLVN